MGMDTLGVMAGHMPLSEIEDRMRDLLPGCRLQIRPHQSTDVMTIIAAGSHGEPVAITAYMNSYAADDYAELGLGSSTMLLMEYSQLNANLMEAIISSRGGWFKRIDGEPWHQISNRLIS